MGKKQDAKSGLGNAIQNAGNAPRTRKQRQDRHLQDVGVDTKSSLSSIIERNDLDEFVAVAMLEQREFVAERGTVHIVDDGTSDVSLPKPSRLPEMYDYAALPIPRRPPWTTDMTRDELEQLERTAFLDWRRDLAHLAEQSKLAITPYEKNLEVWRQLWRVMERSDVVVQIVDARNPLLFLCKDIETVVGPIGKRTLLVVNKADFLSEHMRLCWADYFITKGIEFVFFSAKNEQIRRESEIAESQSGDDDEEPVQRGEEQAEVAPITPISILDTAQLIDRFLSVVNVDRTITVGLIGYPNVGKSSIINALMGEKRVGVASMPGKTRHFQTLILSDRVTLCDCPGLVFPTFMNSQADLVVNGILPIDRLRDFLSPCELVASRVERLQFQNLYGLRFPADLEQLTGRDVLVEFARVRGLVTGRALPDEAMAARYILKDFTNGRLLYCHPPPNCNTTLFLKSITAESLQMCRPQKASPSTTSVDSILESVVTPANPMAGRSGWSMKKEMRQAKARAKAHERGRLAAEVDVASQEGSKARAGKSRNVIAITGY
ncbi:unnamed protein product (mitochondrion) [Plasmodiophora brassicae]|uniref:CP-type G domain-containing protein n=1 Tax=Plasmodiophora brassicae TaxID=37360 RepID=A0A0G4ILA5_PLABS|nr:hypothetical protein PBRA_004590 [Plasmodiophora brassicae]SPR00160.1 unnamed protein product [Plasmodiophora brassicae]